VFEMQRRRARAREFAGSRVRAQVRDYLRGEFADESGNARARA
jgi:hypothetical protein